MNYTKVPTEVYIVNKKTFSADEEINNEMTTPHSIIILSYYIYKTCVIDWLHIETFKSNGKSKVHNK